MAARVREAPAAARISPPSSLWELALSPDDANRQLPSDCLLAGPEAYPNAEKTRHRPRCGGTQMSSAVTVGPTLRSGSAGEG